VELQFPWENISDASHTKLGVWVWDERRGEWLWERYLHTGNPY
jgi:hypothetical protein